MTKAAETPPRLRGLIVMPLGEALGGGEQMLRQLLLRGRDDGIEWIVVFLRSGPMVEEARALGVEVHLLEAGRFRNLIRRLSVIRRIVHLVRARGVDFCFGWMVAGQITAGFAALIAHVPCVWYQVGTPRPDWLDRMATALPACGVLVLSRAGEVAQRRIWPSRPIRLVYPGTPLDALDAVRRIPPIELRAKLMLPPAGPLVGIVGRLQRWKGMHVFLDAVAILGRSHPDIHAVIVGGPHETEPGYGDELRDQARALDVAGAVTFAGFQPNAAEWMQAMDVVVHASDDEPFGIVVIEAMALGKPVVAGAGGGPAEIVTHGQNGLLAAFGDAAALAAAIERYLADPGFAARTGAAARERAQQFSDVTYARNVVTAVRDVVEASTSPHTASRAPQA